jgi:glycosyltransferase involved in cell wall biosynthesis
VRNAGPFLRRSLASLAVQTFRDYEIIAVDDGSTDGSGERLERASRGEPRLTVLRAPAQGLPATLNLALENARSPVIARHDADDISHHERFAIQLRHLAEHPDVTAVGCRVRLFPSAAVTRGMRRWEDWHNTLLTHEEITRDLLMESPLAHGSAMMRREPVERIGGWTHRHWAEDLDLWIRLYESGARFAKRPETLYAWRQHPGSSTRTDRRYHRAAFEALKLDTLERGLLAGRTTVTLVGVGGSLERWRRVLERTGREVRAIEAPRPGPDTLATMAPPVVLVFMAPRRRALWREALARHGWNELREFALLA